MSLNYKEFGTGFPVVILHGLLGSLDNWQTIARKISDLASAANHPFKTYIIDQRNHGRSSHTDDFSYELLSADLKEFFKQQNIARAHVIGHSMGGKAAMKFTLENQDLVEKLIVVDIAPSEAEDHHSYIFEALDAANVASATSREQVEESLRSRIGDDNTTIQFLMKGLQRDASEKNFEWKFNLSALWNHYEDVMGGIGGPKPFPRPTLFIKGGNSDYINAGNFPDAMELFPNNELVEIPGAGHWVQAEKPNEFVEITERFLLAN